MEPNRKTEMNGSLIEEFYWAGRMVVYVDGKLFNGDYHEAIRLAAM